ncbi:MAG: DUF1963 domain-containing protein [Planctomycetota bacterium]|nr:DUF1963 domain-containing protein [Planctomycetota bacterium]
MSNHHPRVDVDRWIEQFPLAADVERALSSAYVTGPEAVAIIEQARSRSGGAAGMGGPCATDVMVWALGEPTDPAATKIGGVPHRPAGVPWPVGRDGQPSTFVAQVCFADSRDVLVASDGSPLTLPGDVLVLFSPNPGGLWDDNDEDPTSLQYEWWPLDLERVMAREDLPEQTWTATAGGTIAPCHAHLHRSADFPAAPDDHPLRQIYDADRLFVHEGGKIGGVPFYTRAESPRPGVFLAAIGSINPAGTVWPFVNVERPPTPAPIWDGDFLTLGDLGSLYLYWEPSRRSRSEGSLHWTVRGS